jgi:hypothetical protein
MRGATRPAYAMMPDITALALTEVKLPTSACLFCLFILPILILAIFI